MSLCNGLGATRGDLNPIMFFELKGDLPKRDIRTKISDPALQWL